MFLETQCPSTVAYVNDQRPVFNQRIEYVRTETDTRIEHEQIMLEFGHSETACVPPMHRSRACPNVRNHGMCAQSDAANRPTGSASGAGRAQECRVAGARRLGLEQSCRKRPCATAERRDIGHGDRESDRGILRGVEDWNLASAVDAPRRLQSSSTYSASTSGRRCRTSRSLARFSDMSAEHE